MRLLAPAQAAAFLQSQGVQPRSEIDKILSGYERSKPIYEHHFFPGDTLYQFIRLTSASASVITRGSWFGLAGITSQGVAIMDGLAGRKLHKFEVVHFFTALEGTAAPLPINWEREIGGPGGSTQIFVPRMHAGKIHPLGPAEAW